MSPNLTPSSTVGPYFGLALTPDELTYLVPENSEGALVLTGSVSDGEGKSVPEAMIEIWQADENGSYELAPVGAGEGFTGFGRCHTDDQGRFRFLTVKPGAVPAPGGRLQAPHINVAVFGGGLLKPLRTRVYFDDESEANAADPVLASVDEERRPLLIARVEKGTATFDIKFQGEDETPFFDA